MTSAADELAWSSEQARGRSGAFESVQRVTFRAPVVERSRAGAARLGELYWDEVERSTLGLVRARVRDAGIELRLLGIGPALLRFAPPDHRLDRETVTCLYAIRGGLLARRPGGSIAFTQSQSEGVEVRSAISGFFPRLAAQRQRRRNGFLYPHVQARLHVALSRRYFARLWLEATR